MTWAYPPVFFLSVLIPLGYRAWVQRSRPAAVSFPHRLPPSLTSMAAEKMARALRVLSLLLLIVAAARPQLPAAQQNRTAQGIDLVLLLDVSPTMDVVDMGDRSRMEIAKETLIQFIAGRQSDRMGLVIFSGEAHTLVPLTLDYPLLLQSIRDADKGVIRDGTAQGDALTLAVGNLKNSRSPSRVIVFVTDGENNVGAIDPDTAAEIAQGYGIRVYTVGIGREGRVKVPIKRANAAGEIVFSHFQWMENVFYPEWLEKLAQMTGGRFYRVQDEATLKRVFHDIDLLEKAEVKAPAPPEKEERFQIFALLALACLAAEFWIRYQWAPVLP